MGQNATTRRQQADPPPLSPYGYSVTDEASADIIECREGHPDCPEYGHFAPPVTEAREVTGPELLGQLTSRQADLLEAKFRAAYIAVAALKDGAAWRSAEWDGLDALWDDLHGLAADAGAAVWAIHLRETDSEIVAAARRLNHLRDITAAERLLAAERTPAAS